MSKKKLLSMAISWRVCLITLTLLVLAQLAVVWMSGGRETRDALAEGRRFLITLETGEIEGKRVPEAAVETPQPDVPPVAVPEPAPASDVATPAEPAAGAEENTAPPDIAAPEIVPVETGKEVVIVPETEEEALPPVAPSISAPQVAAPELTEKSEMGPLPRMGGDGSKPWRFYAKPYIRKGNKPMIAIVITGLGPSQRLNELAIRLPEPMTLSFSPYTRDLANWVAATRLAGHEMLLDLPIEPVNYPAADPGPLGLLVSKDQQGNETRLKKTMGTATGYMGFLTPQDEVLSANNDLFKSLLQVLSTRGLMLVVGKQPHKSETRELLDTGNTANFIADTLIDEELTPVAIQARLSSLEQTAKQRGYAVGIAQAYPLTVEQLHEWADKLDENGFSLVPVSLVVMQRYKQ